MDKLLGGTPGTAHKDSCVCRRKSANAHERIGSLMRGKDATRFFLGFMGNSLKMIAARLPSVADHIMEQKGVLYPRDATGSSSPQSSIWTDGVSSADPVGLRVGARSPTLAIAEQEE